MQYHDQAFESLAFYLHKVSSLTDTRRNRLIRDSIGISNVQYLFLKTLEEGIVTDNPTQQEIANSLGITKSTLSRQISIVYQRGWINVLRSEQSRRENTITLTDKGRSILEDAQRAIAQGTQDIQELLSAQDILLTTATLRGIAEVIEIAERDTSSSE